MVVDMGWFMISFRYLKLLLECSAWLFMHSLHWILSLFSVYKYTGCFLVAAWPAAVAAAPLFAYIQPGPAYIIPFLQLHYSALWCCQCQTVAHIYSYIPEQLILQILQTWPSRICHYVRPDRCGVKYFLSSEYAFSKDFSTRHWGWTTLSTK